MDDTSTSVATADKPAWRSRLDAASLPESNATIPVPQGGSWVRRLLAFAGPGYMISVGYMDPGNWATDIAGGSKYGYTLLSVVLVSSLLAVLLQGLSARLGIATGRDLAQACRDSYPRPVSIALWIACELAIIACDLAEVIGTAIALNLLFGMPLVVGALLTALDAFLLLLLMQRGFRFLEAFVGALLLVIAGCFAVQIALASPPVAAVLGGFIPRTEVLTNPGMLYLAIGILGATVMPHNLYLHSSIVQTRAYPRTDAGRKQAVRWATVDSTIALTLALFVNAAILVVAAAVFHTSGHHDVAEIGDAHKLLAPLLGAGIASTLFALALLASGLNSTVTATLAGQIVMEGFLRMRLPQWVRRLVTRAIAIVPVVVVTAIYGERGTSDLLVFSQVALSLQLPFAVVPLVMFVTDRGKMGRLAIGRPMAALAWAATALIIALNLKLIYDAATGVG
ncbi:MAG TPA: Nramp family divalent metal transporter [Acetobacteraceae bacterium]